MLLLGCFLSYSLQKVSRQQILEACLKKFLNGFHPCLEISCSHPCFKENSDLEVQKPWIPHCLPLFYFIIFFKREIYFFSKGIYCCSPNFYLFRKLKQDQDKTAWTQRGILTQYSQCTLKGDLCLLCTLCICFSFEVHLNPWFTSSMNLASGLTHIIEVFPARVSPQNIYIQCLWKY